jgi:hypothetical protein
MKRSIETLRTRRPGPKKAANNARPMDVKNRASGA